MEKLILMLGIFNRYRCEKFSDLLVSQGAMAVLILATVGLVALFNSQRLDVLQFEEASKAVLYEVNASVVMPSYDAILSVDKFRDSNQQMTDPGLWDWILTVDDLLANLADQSLPMFSSSHDFYKTTAESLLHARAGPPAIDSIFSRLSSNLSRLELTNLLHIQVTNEIYSNYLNLFHHGVVS